MAKKICSIDDCNRPVASRGWCRMHYKRWAAHGDPLFLKMEKPKPVTFQIAQKRAIANGGYLNPFMEWNGTGSKHHTLCLKCFQWSYTYFNNLTSPTWEGNGCGPCGRKSSGRVRMKPFAEAAEIALEKYNFKLLPEDESGVEWWGTHTKYPGECLDCHAINSPTWKSYGRDNSTQRPCAPCGKMSQSYKAACEQKDIYMLRPAVYYEVDFKIDNVDIRKMGRGTPGRIAQHLSRVGVTLARKIEMNRSAAIIFEKHALLAIKRLNFKGHPEYPLGGGETETYHPTEKQHLAVTMALTEAVEDCLWRGISMDPPEHI